jgi:tetratricopeptide (TPR) repeat protein
MILHLADSLTRGLMVVTALLIGLWLSWFGVRAAIARFGYEVVTAERLALAVRMEPGNPKYWNRLGQYQKQNLLDHDQDSFRKAIALNPLDTNAWLDLAADYEFEGKNSEAREAYLQAKKSYPSSADVSWRYGNFLMRQGDQPDAYAQLRQAIEGNPKLAAIAFSRAYRSNPDINQILNQLLPANQSAYVGMLNESAGENQLAVAQIIWARLLTLHPHLEVRDFEPLVSKLLGSGEYYAGRRVWDQGIATLNLPPLLQLDGSVVWDPSFESNINGLGFAWQFKPIVQGVSIGYDTTEGHSGSQSLRLSFDGKHNPDLEAACTFAVVQPSTTYRFSGWIKTKNITTEFGLGFRLHSYGNSAGPVVNTDQIVGSHPFTRIDQIWTAGADVQRVVICVIREASDNPDVRISGTAWVDDVDLVPQPAEPHTP